MANTYKILGQSAPANTSNADLYTVPSGRATIVSTIHVANVTGTDATCRIFVVESGDSAVAGNAIAYDVTIAANSMAAFTTGITLAAGDKLVVRTDTSNSLTFHAFGSEVN
jgi:hypothetical protein